MAMNRAAALEYLDDQYASSSTPYLTMAGISVVDAAGGVRSIIDDALLALGVDYADLASGAPSNIQGYRAALRYFALRFVWENLNQSKLLDSAAVGSGVGVKAEEWRKHIPQQIAVALNDAIAYDVELPNTNGTSSWAALGEQRGMLGINMDYLQQPTEAG